MSMPNYPATYPVGPQPPLEARKQTLAALGVKDQFTDSQLFDSFNPRNSALRRQIGAFDSAARTGKLGGGTIFGGQS